MTQGRPLGLLLYFAVPLMPGSLFQILYSAADGAVVGRIMGVDAFASIGVANFLVLLAFEIVLGLTQGFGVVFAQLFGKKDYPSLRGAVAVALLLSAGISVLLTALGLVCAKPVLMLMDTPRDLLPYARIYVCWMYGGIAVTLANRLLSTLLLSLGNSRIPVAANAASCVLNILLDLLFVAGFHWGVAGAAAAEKFFELITFSGSAFEGAFGIYSAQNFGAGDMPRLKKGLHCSVLLSLAGASAMAAAVIAFGRKLIGLLITGEPGDIRQIIQTGYEYLVILAVTVPLMFLLCLYRAGLQGMGGGASAGCFVSSHVPPEDTGTGKPLTSKMGLRDAPKAHLCIALPQKSLGHMLKTLDLSTFFAYTIFQSSLRFSREVMWFCSRRRAGKPLEIQDAAVSKWL